MRRILFGFLFVAAGCVSEPAPQETKAASPSSVSTSATAALTSSFTLVSTRPAEPEPQEAFQLPLRNPRSRPLVFLRDDSFTFTITSDKDTAIRLRLMVVGSDGEVIADEVRPIQVYRLIPSEVNVPVAVAYTIPPGQMRTLSVRLRVLWQESRESVSFRVYPSRFTISAPQGASSEPAEDPSSRPPRNSNLREF